MTAPSRRAAYFALAGTAALWGSSAVVARGMLDSLPPVWLAALRWVAVLALLAPFVWRDRAAIAHALRHDWRGLALFAALGFAPQTLFIYVGLAGTTAINFGLLNSAIPVMIIAIVAVLHRRRPRALETLGLVLSLAGVLVIVARGDLGSLAHLAINPSDLVVLCAMFVWALYTVKLARRASGLQFPSFIFAAGLVGLALILPLVVQQALAQGLPWPTAGEWMGIAYIGAFPTLVATLLFGYGIARVGAVQAGIFTHLVPVFSALFATAWIGERLHLFHAAGFALVAGGALLCCLRGEPMLSSPPGVARRARTS